jgi:hypothetical protein
MYNNRVCFRIQYLDDNVNWSHLTLLSWCLFDLLPGSECGTETLLIFTRLYDFTFQKIASFKNLLYLLHYY